MTASISQVSAILNHDRAATSWVVRPILVDGAPKIERIARIVWVFPKDGAGRLRVAVTDWSTGEAVHHVAHAGGFGYDKRTVALSGASIGGFVLGDHCDREGRPTLADLARREGWEVFEG